MVTKKKGPAKAKKPPASEGKALQTKYQTLLGLISYGIPYYFATAGSTEKQKKMLEAVKKKWDELARELSSIRNLQHDCDPPFIWCEAKCGCMTLDECNREGP